ncbi:MAG: hypothetical protein ACKVW3_09615 [Phycisphaerales bacterium]
MFETFGPEFEFVRSQPPCRVWTLIDTDDGPCVVSGMHFVNRLGYLVSRDPRPDEADIVVMLDDLSAP